jgi:hypothetical protein
MATATTPTTSTTVGLLSLCSNLLTYSWALPFYHGPSGPQRITQTAKPRSQAPLLLRRVLRRTPFHALGCIEARRRRDLPSIHPSFYTGCPACSLTRSNSKLACQ